MSEDSELQAKIAALAGRINVHKQQQQNAHLHPEPYYGNNLEQQLRHGLDNIADTGQGQGRGRGRGGWAPHRGTPYGAPRGRGGKVFNRSLVLNNNRANGTASPANAAQSNGSGANGHSAPTTPVNEGSGWVVKRDRHMQLINPAIYDQVAQQRAKAMEQTAEQRRQQRNMKEKAKLSKHFQTAPDNASADGQNAATPQTYEIEVENIRFRVADGGSKLIRISNDPNTARSTPKQAKIGGVTFLRSKNGNLYRSGLVKTKQNKPIKKINEPCPRFTTTGTCAKGPQCRYLHDPNKVAICKDFLQRNNCPLGDACDLSHDATPNRVPACVHFLRGNCTNDNCRYAHIRVNPSAPVCRAFGTLGYCEKGSDCAERHVFECPDYANHAVCRNAKCRLPHVDRAGQIRKAAAAQTAATDALGSPDLSSDEEYDEIDSDDVDSEDEIEEDVIMQGFDDNGQELSQQRDFVSF